MIPKILFLLALVFAASGWASPPLALALGLAFGLIFANPYPDQTAKSSKSLLQASVVGLGFGMNLHDVVRAGRSGFVYTLLGIAFAMTVGLTLGRLLNVQRIPAFLISTG
ncbi:MAG TPA: putative sulfate exporter family transporter, partial [Anaerolineae bacterium]